LAVIGLVDLTRQLIEWTEVIHQIAIKYAEVREVLFAWIPFYIPHEWHNPIVLITVFFSVINAGVYQRTGQFYTIQLMKRFVAIATRRSLLRDLSTIYDEGKLDGNVHVSGAKTNRAQLRPAFKQFCHALCQLVRRDRQRVDGSIPDDAGVIDQLELPFSGELSPAANAKKANATGDVLIVRLDRLARSTRNLLNTLSAIIDRIMYKISRNGFIVCLTISAIAYIISEIMLLTGFLFGWNILLFYVSGVGSALALLGVFFAAGSLLAWRWILGTALLFSGLFAINEVYVAWLK
jgi:hypothetical protein